MPLESSVLGKTDMILRSIDAQITREEQLRTEVRDLITERDEFYRANRELSQENDRLVAQAESLGSGEPADEKIVQEKQSLERDVQHLRSSNEALTMRVGELQSAKDSSEVMQNDLRRIQELLSSTQTETRELKRINREMTAEARRFSSQLDATCAELDVVRAELLKSRESQDRNFETLGMMQIEITTAQREANQLRQRLAEAQRQEGSFVQDTSNEL